MYLTYRPVGDPEPQEFVFIPGKTNSFDSEAIENVTEWTWEEFLANLQKGSMKARRALLWVMLRRIHRGLRFKDVSCTPDEVKVEYDVYELTELRQNIEDSNRSDEEKEPYLAYVDQEIAKARPAPDESGKAPELYVADGTGLPSHSSALVRSNNDS
jgi:hypothetical protein